MSEELSRLELLGLLDESKVLTPGEIERIAEAHPRVTGDGLAHAYVEAGLLTQFQMDAIIAGTAAELRIGNYEVLDRLGAGGMGTVYKARHRRMKRIVALKVLAKNLSKDPTFVKRFQREVETIAQLNHPNIVMAYDADEADVGHFLVMEFVDGQDLASAVQKHGPMNVRSALECILHTARGLAYAHGQKIIHRDIKPANLLQDAGGIVKVTDLGLARLNANAMFAGETAAAGVTQAGSVLGTADYMPPEQAVDSSTVDHRADIYSLGATLYFLLTGHGPYSGTSLMAILLKHREAPIPSLCDAQKDIPPALDDLFRRMLAKEPRHRPQEMTQIVESLEKLLTNLGAASLAPTLTGTALADRPTDASQVLEKTVAGPFPRGGKHAERAAPAPPTTSSILLVEPSRTQAGIIRKYLQSIELVNVVSAATGAEALQAIATNRPDVVITAMHLNDMTGTQLAQQIRLDNAAAAPGFVLISSESESKEAEVLGHSGHAALLHKPFTAESLMNALKLASPVFANLKPPSGPSTAAPKPLQARSQSRVLLVDDSAAARLHIRSVLAGLGLTQVSEAEDGAQAVAFLARERFDLIITDYNMPLMDGRGLIGYVRQNAATASVPIIMVTTETDPSKLDAVRQLGVTICEKSFPVDVARKILDTLLKG